MENPDAQARFCSELIAGLADAGVTTAFVSPGSRNTPLTLAILAEPRITDVNVIDERSAAFMAVGHAKATDRPAVVVSTSGSAPAHYLPAIIEANQSATPLIVLSADRPVHLRGTSAPQTMDQTHLYGGHVKHFIDAAETAEGRDLAIDLVSRSMSAPHGPVHANLPFDEPLLPSFPQGVPPQQSIDRAASHPPTPTGVLDGLTGMRTVIVAGGRHPRGFGDALGRIAASLDAPIIADPQVAIAGPSVVRYGDLLVGAHDASGRRFVLEALEPEAILRFGPLPTSKPLWEWFGTFEGLQVHVDDSRLRDPFAARTTHVVAAPLTFLTTEPIPKTGESGYAERWTDLDEIAEHALREALERLSFPNEPVIARIVATAAPPGSILYLASSRPIRDVDAFAPNRADLMPLANRGVNGIDGTISSAIGATAGGPVTLLIGDVAALHDAQALGDAARFGVPLRVVVVNNDGGGIFEFLPQARSALLDRTAFDRHWGTPHGLSLATIANAYGLAADVIDDAGSLERRVAAPIVGPELLEIRTDRRQVVRDHTTIREAVSAALRRGNDVE